MDLTIILPVRNEEKNLRPLIEEIEETLQNICEYTVIFVDDASTDRSPRIINELVKNNENHKALHFKQHAGQSAAFAAGFEKVDTSYIVTMDADRQNDPADLPSMLNELDNYDMVAGYRTDRKDNLLRSLVSKFANAVRNYVTDDSIVDIGCSLKVFRRSIVDDVPYFQGMHRFLPTLAKREGYSVTQVPTKHRPRKAGTAKYGFIDRFPSTLFDLLGVRWLLSRKFDYEISKCSE